MALDIGLKLLTFNFQRHAEHGCRKNVRLREQEGIKAKLLLRELELHQETLLQSGASSRPGVNFINVIIARFSLVRSFGNFFYVHVNREVLPKQCSYEKRACITLMKLTVVWLEPKSGNRAQTGICTKSKRSKEKTLLFWPL